MKEFLKKKKFLISTASVLILIVLIVGSIFLFKGSKEDTKENKILKEQSYTMYVKINPLVKLTFKETYYECSYVDDNGKDIKTICSDKEDSVTEYELINDDAKDIYNTIDFKGKTVLDALIVLCDVARDNKVAFENLEIVSDYNFDKEEFIQKIESGSKYENKINVYVDFKEYIKDDEIIKDLEKEETTKTYIVSFDSNGGSKIEKQEIKENEKATEPTKPAKTGYDFVEWQLNGRKYDFGTGITSNIKLTATWKKKTNQNNNNNQQKPNTGNNNQSNNNNQNTNNNNNNEEKPKPTEPTKPVSTSDKINLNDNILVYEKHEDPYFYGWILAHNFKDIFGKNEIRIEYYYGEDKCRGDGDISSDEYDKLKTKLTINQNDINNFLATFEKAKNSKISNMINLDYIYDSTSHMFSYSYDYLEVADKGISNLKYLGNKNNPIDNIMKSSFVHTYSHLECAGGGGDYLEPKLLNETLCSKYNLNCSRW